VWTKMQLRIMTVAVLLSSVALASVVSRTNIPDQRHIQTGKIIPDLSYSDQPYIVKTDDGAWLCCLTTGASHEGKPGQIVMTQRSLDQGTTWQDRVQIEPPSGPEASYAVMLKIPGGRVYIFYNHNTDNLRRIKADNPPYRDGWCSRVDSQGYFVFKYSDDHGKTWSEKRHPIPIRTFEIDRNNAYQGAIQFFWNVGKPFVLNGCGYVSLHKVGGFGAGFFTSNEGVLLLSDNLLTEADPEKIHWQTLPDGDIGLRTPPGGGSISAEQSYSLLSDGSIYCVYRSIDGHPVNTYSRDGAHTWEPPQYKRYANGRLMKHPRAANFAWRCQNGKYLYWFHNHGGRFIREHPQRRSMAYADRNPAWLCGGVEADSPSGKIIKWTQPEILLYDDDTYVRMSYPDLVEENGAYYVTETQKDVARVHRIDLHLLDTLWQQFDAKEAAEKGLVLDIDETNGPHPATIKMPPLPQFIGRDTQRKDMGSKDLRAGFSLDLWFQLKTLKPGQILLDNRTEAGKGFALLTTEKGTIEIILNDGRTESRWDCDPGLIRTNTLHHLVVTVDSGPKIITFIVDGLLCDGGDYRQFGWGRFSPQLRGVNGSAKLHMAPESNGQIKSLRIYNRYILTSEAIGNYRAGLESDLRQ
jgi:hypothetical protein